MDEMDAVTYQELSGEDFMRPRCKVKVGDIIYRKSKSMTIPDRMKVTDIKPNGKSWLITVHYMYHTIGPFERIYSDVIFNDDSWVIERKGLDFRGL